MKNPFNRAEATAKRLEIRDDVFAKLTALRDSMEDSMSRNLLGRIIRRAERDYQHNLDLRIAQTARKKLDNSKVEIKRKLDNEASKKVARNKSQRWTEGDDKIVLESKDRDMTIAMTLGRTIAAVRGRRGVLKRAST